MPYQITHKCASDSCESSDLRPYSSHAEIGSLNVLVMETYIITYTESY